MPKGCPLASTGPISFYRNGQWWPRSIICNCKATFTSDLEVPLGAPIADSLKIVQQAVQ